MSAAGTETNKGAEPVIRMGKDGRPLLRGGRCPDCRTPHFPLQPVCPVCAGERVMVWDMPRYGTLYSFSVLHVGGKDGTPRAFGYIDMPNGVRMFTPLKEIEHEIGETVWLALNPDHAEDEPEFIFTREGGDA